MLTLYQGERRFYLGAVVDDLFLKTPEFSYGEGGVDENGDDLHEGTVRIVILRVLHSLCKT